LWIGNRETEEKGDSKSSFGGGEAHSKFYGVGRSRKGEIRREGIEGRDRQRDFIKVGRSGRWDSRRRGTLAREKKRERSPFQNEIRTREDEVKGWGRPMTVGRKGFISGEEKLFKENQEDGETFRLLQLTAPTENDCRGGEDLGLTHPCMGLHKWGISCFMVLVRGKRGNLGGGK